MSEADWAGPHRFFVDPSSIVGGLVHFDRDRSHQLSRVLRARTGELVIVLDNLGSEHLVRLTEVGPRAVIGEVLEQRPSRGDPRLSITLYQALLPREPLELAVQKATECGVARIVPLITERVVARASAADWSARAERLIRIAREAAEQSERARVPMIEPPMSLASAAADAINRGPVLVAWERGAGQSFRVALRDVLAKSPRELGIVIGPEGGISQREIEELRASGAHLGWLGPRILRAETAGAIIVAVMLYEAGEMGG